jgi:hypothetical protein
MADKCNVTEFLKFELEFLEDGGYGRSPRKPWLQPVAFLDSPSCLNFGDVARGHPCNNCVLMQFVPAARRSEAVPCHHIPLNQKRETLDSLSCYRTQREIEDTLEGWLRQTIARLDCRDTSDTSKESGTLTLGACLDATTKEQQL